MPTIKQNNPVRNDRTLGKRVYQKVYQDKRWKRLRQVKFMENPICEKCRERGITTVTQHIHHVKPFDVNSPDLEARAFDYDNLISLCVECHNKMHRGSNIEFR